MSAVAVCCFPRRARGRLVALGALAVALAVLAAAPVAVGSPRGQRDVSAPKRVVATDTSSRGLLLAAPGSERPSSRYPVTPLVGRRVEAFVRSKSDLARSTALGWIVVPLVLGLLVEVELLAAAGRPEARTLRAFGWPLIALFVMLVIVRLKAYAG